MARARSTLQVALPLLADDPRVPNTVQALLLEAREQLASLEARIARCDLEIKAHVADNEPATRVRELLGIGPLTASALVATVTNATASRTAGNSEHGSD